MKILGNIKPQNVMKYFEDICAIPHGSGNTDKISDYCIKTAKNLGLYAEKDGMNNVIIKKSGSTGFENHPTVILQAHLDMVCEKTPECEIDFEKDSIPVTVDGDFITADGTTLGGDDGIGVAMIFAVLEDNTLPHPPIEAVFTNDEETGMFGADALDGTKLSGRKLINIDSEAEGILTVSCAGGARCEIRIPTKKTDISSPCYEIIIEGLAGGHSGVEIDKGRHNSNILMGKLLKKLPYDYNIISLKGGSKDNAIPARTLCEISLKEDISSVIASFKEENTNKENPNLKISIKEIAPAKKGITKDNSKKIAEFLSSVPNGVQKMSKDIEGLVQTSLNLGILSTKEDEIFMSFSVRSSVNEEKTELLSRLKTFALDVGGSYGESGHYPAWEYRKNSPLRDVMVNEFEKMYQKKPIVEAIHAGLECGILSEKLPGLDAVSFGPDMEGVHTPAEKLSISSVERCYRYLCEVLKNL